MPILPEWPVVRFKHPKIMLIDVEPAAETALRGKGFNVTVGSLGRLYRTEPTPALVPVVSNGNLPDFPEQEIVVIDLIHGDSLPEKPPPPMPEVGEEGPWTREPTGIIDPRPRAVQMYARFAARISSHGGAFVIFARPRIVTRSWWGHFEHRSFIGNEHGDLDDWSILEVLRADQVAISLDQGEEMTVADTSSRLGALLAGFLPGSRYACRITAQQPYRYPWTPIITSKYKAIVGAIQMIEGRGPVLILPDIRDRAGFLVRLIDEVLPDLCPRLYASREGAAWVERPTYEIPSVVVLKQEITALEEQTRQAVLKVQTQIDAERERLGFMHDILRETGDRLVRAVKSALEQLGLERVIDADGVAEDRKREDLQILDASPAVLVEVKGIGGIPTEADALQVGKYIAPRMKQWGRTDVRGLAVVNHQRHLPALDRTEKPFNDDILTNACQQEFGLITTWDLYRLVRNAAKLGWDPEVLKCLVYKNGRIEPIPAHYMYVGKVENFWERAGAVSIAVEGVSVREGDTLAFEGPVEFHEQIVESLRLEGTQVQEATRGQVAGVKTHLTKDTLTKSVRVYRASRVPNSR